MAGLKTTPFKVGISTEAISYIAGKNKNLTLDQVKKIITNVLDFICPNHFSLSMENITA